MNFINELKDLKRISEASLYSVLVIMVLSMVFSVVTGSVTLLVVFIWAIAALIVKIFAVISIRIMLKENQFMFPFGAGKIENFTSFFFGFVIVPFGCYFLIISAIRLFSPLPAITYLLCQVPVLVSFIRSITLTIWTRGILRQTSNPSPMLKAYFTDFKVSLTTDSLLFIAFLAGYLLSVAKLQFFSIRVDPVLSIILSLYMIWAGLPLIVENLRSLFDLPLPEQDMLKILKVAAEFNNEYSGFGMIYSRQTGKHKIIEMELFYDPGLSLEKINRIEQQMGLRINQDFPDVWFRVIPKVN
ncbi:MAG: cation transporter [Bacteroidota bacterium]